MLLQVIIIDLLTGFYGVYGLGQLPPPDYEYYDVPQLHFTPSRSSAKTARPYKFDYNIADHEGNQQYRIERADAQNTKTGAYGYREVNGIFRHVNYIADKYGFRAVVNTSEPGTAPMDSADAVFNAAPIKVLPVKAPQHSVAAQNIWGRSRTLFIGYDITDEFGTRLFYNEQSDNKNAKTGTYGYRDANGIFRTVSYVADADGYRATIETNKPGTAPGASADAVFNANPVAAPATAPRPGGYTRTPYTGPAFTGPAFTPPAAPVNVRGPGGYTGG
ncbi:hypothetical protein HPB49_000142 [Dermacentor silvarum]|uniref:Uncharacterized protein n=1 Tax=Dermacentor silvarum TaxID=543639 RepID=A0ACB8D9H4_DERSI|nr:hypothetical protein HPB49_000142 [Dermacentor silvarum]